MDRTIKFRVWSLKNKCWCYPVLDITNDFNIKNKDSEYQYVFMQFTGLYDCEGKEIYEGDIASAYNQIPFVQAINKKVVYKNCSFVFEQHDLDSKTRTLASSNCKIIGNVFEHPQLLNNEG